MPSLIYNTTINNLIRGDIDFDANTFKVMLVTSSYSPNKDTHNDRANVTNEVGASGTYATGGGTTTATVQSIDTVNNDVEVAFSSVSFTSATITARAAVIYKSTGTAANDLLIAYVDFGTDVSSTSGTFTVNFTSNFKIAVV